MAQLKKRKKITTDLDNMGPIKQILDELRHKNPEAFKFYCKNLYRRHAVHYDRPGYPLSNFCDEWNGECGTDTFDNFGYKSCSPKIITQICNIDKEDPVTSYMKKKHDWLKNYKRNRFSAVLNKSVDKLEVLNEEVIKCPKHLVNLAAYLDSDPEPYFNSRFNWYYAGYGNLQLVNLECIDYILYSMFSVAYLKEFNRNNLIIKSEAITSFDCGDGYNIFETICSTNNIVCLRTRNKVFVLKITLDNEVKLKKLTTLESEIPYTSISLDSYHKNILYITTLDRQLNIINVDTFLGKKIQLAGKSKSLVNNWNMVISSERNCYIHIMKNAICMYDKRSNDLINVWKGVKELVDDANCDSITVARQFPNSDYLHFATDHHLFLLDIRFCTQFKPEVVRRWTHGMLCPPVYIDVCSYELKKEMICLSSQWVEDMCIVPSYAKDIVNEPIKGFTLPYRPPSILSVLAEARQQLLCSDLYNPIDSRLTSSMCGALVLEQGDSYQTLLLNSLGDIINNSIYPEHFYNFVLDEGPKQLHEWSKSYKTKQKLFEVSKIVDFGSVCREIRKIPDQVKIMSDLENVKFDEKEILDAFENEEIDSTLQYAWTGDAQLETAGDQTNIFYESQDSEVII